MLDRRLISTATLAALLAAAPATDALAAIYKTVDEDGNVVFTDVPPAKGDGAAVDLSAGNRYAPAPVTTPLPAPAAAQEEEEEQEITSYERIGILAPANDEAIRDNAGNLSVRYALSPSLDTKHGHSLRLLLDGVPQAGEAGEATFSFTNLDRGTHTLTLQVVNASGQVLNESAPVSFHMLRFSALQRSAN